MTGYLFAAACVAVMCACYGAGRAAWPRRWTTAVAAGALCVSAVQFTFRPLSRTTVTGFVSAYLVFAVLPLIAGRYVAQQRKMAGRERVRERLGIAREMHDSLGRRLSLAAVQAAALEVSDLPASQRAAVGRLATAIRASHTELHEILGAVRGERAPAQGMALVGGLIQEFRAVGAEVSVRSRGRPQPLAHQAGKTAYRVCQEGLTNAVRHAPGQPVAVTIEWTASALRLTVTNPAGCHGYVLGSGLTDLAADLRDIGGTLGHQAAGGRFVLHAAVPFAPAPGTRQRSGVTALGLAVGILLLVILPVTVLLGLS